MNTGDNIAQSLCQLCHTIPCVCRRPGDVHHFHTGLPLIMEPQLTAEAVRRIVREELERFYAVRPLAGKFDHEKRDAVPQGDGK